MTKEEIKQKIEELKKKKAELDVLVLNQDNTQVAYKVFLNSVYGFTGTQYSPVFNKDIAEAVTLTGQKTIKEMVRFTNSELNKLNSDMKDDKWVIAGDTDSVSADTVISVDGKEMAIEDAFNLVKSTGFIDKLQNGTEVAIPSKPMNTSTLLLNNCKLNNISRHKVTKKRWKIQVPGSSKPLYVTEDHSVIVKRDGEYCEVSPKDIKPTDFIIVKKYAKSERTS